MPSSHADDRRDRFERLFNDHHTNVRAYVRRRSDAAMVDDVVAETFLVAWRRLDAVPPEAGPWLFGVARRVLSTQRRAERRRSALLDRLSVTAPPAALSPDGLGEDDALRRALARLSERDREALLLVAWEDLSIAEAAAAMGVAPVTMRVRLHRARRRLAAALTADDGARGPSTRARECE